MVERITSPDGGLDALVIRAGAAQPGTTFHTAPADQLQVATMLRKKGECVPVHEHKPPSRVVFETAEVLVIKSGHVRAYLYDGSDWRFLALVSGDVLVIFKGQHAFDFMEDTELWEIKQGPYIEDKVYG